MPQKQARRRSPATSRVPKALLLDALGTLLRLRSPAPVLRESLAREGHEHPYEAVQNALRQEIRYYREHHLRGSDPVALAALRADCASVLARRLGDDVPPLPRLTEMLLDSLRFEPAPGAREAVGALADAGWRLAVVSNWDVSLAESLRPLGLHEPFDAVVTSAFVGAAKPDPAIFRHALERLGVAPDRAVHCGDQMSEDVEGARRAGIRAILVGEPEQRPATGPMTIRSLHELPEAALRALNS